MATKPEYDKKYKQLSEAILQRVITDPEFKSKLLESEKARHDVLAEAGFKQQIDELAKLDPQLEEAEVAGHCSYSCYTSPSGSWACNPYICTGQ